MSRSKLFFALDSSLGVFATVLVLLASSQSAAAQTLTSAMVEKHIAEIAAAYTTHDSEAVVRFDSAAPGSASGLCRPARPIALIAKL